MRDIFNTAFLLSIMLLYSSVTAAQANAKSRGQVVPSKYAAFVMDADTGITLHQYNADKPLHPASLTKMMTLLMLFDALERKEVRMHTKIRISHRAANAIPSKIGLAPGKTIRVKDAIYALTTKSANDIAIAVAEKLGGSEWQFARLMTLKAQQLGMRHTNFVNASGLHHKRQTSTARDMARLSQVLVNDYREYYHFFSAKSFKYRGVTYRSHNKLMNSYQGMDGLKTGYIGASGFNLASSAKRDGHRLIGIVFGGRTSSGRNNRMAYLLDNAFEKLNNTHLLASYRAPIPQRKPYIDESIEVASMPNIITPQSDLSGRWKMLNTDQDNSMFNRMIGQGDYDITARNRIETGLIAISAQMKEHIPQYIWDAASPQTSKIVSLTPAKTSKNAVITSYSLGQTSGNWTIQIGAFSNRNHTNKVIAKTLKKLPASLSNAKAIVAPISTKNGWIYRARLTGYSKEAAKDACKMLNDCITLSPKI